MGICKSRQCFGKQRRKSSASSNEYFNVRTTKRGSFFQRKKRNSTKPIVPSFIEETDYLEFPYGANAFGGPVPIYTAFPKSSQYMPLNQNYSPAYPYSSPQPMMMLPQPVAPMVAPQYASQSAPIATPYISQVPVSSNYNNIMNPGVLPVGSLGRPNMFPVLNATPMGRLLTDWTRGGKISPGFLGPPI